MRLIDADKIKRFMFYDMETKNRDKYNYRRGWNEAIYAILENEPTVDAELVRHGRWVKYPIADGINQCSECGVLCFGQTYYCPTCGAKMR